MHIRLSLLKGCDELPLVVEPATVLRSSASDLQDLIRNQSEWLNGKLHHYGAVLFRGFAVRETAEFQQISQAVIPQPKPYIEGQSPRTKLADNVYTSTEFPSQYRITLHNELSYTKSPPSRIVFYCQVPPVDRGETPIVDCRKIYKLLSPGVRDRFERLGVKYVKNMHGQARGLGKSWMDHFETSDRDAVQDYLQNNEIDFEWADDGTLRTWSVRPGVQKHSVNGQSHWFNQSNLWHSSNLEPRHRQQLLDRFGIESLPTHAYYGDGSVIEDSDLHQIRELLWDQSVIFPWEHGDVLVLDNFLVAHGRNAFSGPRKILVALG